MVDIRRRPNLADDLARFLNYEPIRAARRHAGPCLEMVQASPPVGQRQSACRYSPCSSSRRAASRSADDYDSNRRTEEKRRELQVALARQVAERLDSDLRQLAAGPRTLAVMLAERSDWTEPQLDDALSQMLDADSRLFGMCIAPEPNQFEAGRENYARYIFRGNSSAQLKYLHPPQYRPYREWDWYRVPRREHEARGRNPTSTAAAARSRWSRIPSPPAHGQFIGVVTADLSLAYFRQLKNWLDELQLSRGDYGFVVSPAGTLISDANPEYQMGRRIDEFAGPSSKFRLRKLEARKHILEGQLIALDHLDEVIALIRGAHDRDTARTGLIDRFGLTYIQAQAILELRLQQLTALESDAIRREHADIVEQIAELRALLGDEARVLELIKEELTEVRDRYGDERRTQITYAEDDLDIEDLIADQQMVITITSPATSSRSRSPPTGSSAAAASA